jgi:LytS/YehU family sensor histidine kinase
MIILQSTDSLVLLDADKDLLFQIIMLALIPVILAFTFIIFVFYRGKRESLFRQKEAELKLSVAEEELKVLLAQINPHFIFNCLNSIHHFMQQNNLDKAGDYLVKFSRLIRYVLESSTQRMVPLEDEIEANKIYMELERLRMNEAFDFRIACEASMKIDQIYIPPMLIQPFIENAIWHGASQDRKVELDFSFHDDMHILCRIRDNGKNDTSKSDIDLSLMVKKTSKGLILMQDRFQTLNKLHNTKAGFQIANREDGNPGKQVDLILNYED